MSDKIPKAEVHKGLKKSLTLSVFRYVFMPFKFTVKYWQEIIIAFCTIGVAAMGVGAYYGCRSEIEEQKQLNKEKTKEHNKELAEMAREHANLLGMRGVIRCKENKPSTNGCSSNYIDGIPATMCVLFRPNGNGTVTFYCKDNLCTIKEATD